MTRVVSDIEDAVNTNGTFLKHNPAYDKILNSEVSLQWVETISTVKVNKCVIGNDGTTASTYDSNPYLNSMIYQVEFHGVQVKEYAANVIAKNILTQVDADGFSLTMLDAIIDYQKDKYFYVLKADMHVVKC